MNIVIAFSGLLISLSRLWTKDDTALGYQSAHEPGAKRTKNPSSYSNGWTPESSTTTRGTTNNGQCSLNASARSAGFRAGPAALHIAAALLASPFSLFHEEILLICCLPILPYWIGILVAVRAKSPQKTLLPSALYANLQAL